jgi:hypothetical protein
MVSLMLSISIAAWAYMPVVTASILRDRAIIEKIRSDHESLRKSSIPVMKDFLIRNRAAQEEAARRHEELKRRSIRNYEI